MSSSLAAAEQRRLRPNINTLELRSDRLGTLVRSLSRKLSSSRSWESFVTGHRGRSYLSAIHHFYHGLKAVQRTTVRP